MSENFNEFEKKILERIESVNVDKLDLSNWTPLEVATKIFKFNGFKQNNQEEIIDFILKRKGDALGIIPTGGGNSACFQIPALIQKNTTIVISPLIALIKDQVESLVKKGVNSVFFVNSSINEDVKERIFGLLESNKVKLLYVAPESLQSERLSNVISNTKVDLIVVDEAHCISTWGHDFRPDYLNLPDLIKKCGNPPVLSLTATATPSTIKDIQKQLKRDFRVFKASFDRPLLYLVVQPVPDNVDKESFLINLVKKLKGPSIIFARTQDLTAVLSEALNNNGVRSIFYHAGLTSEEREKRQNSFMNGDCDVVVATIAFGMGLDKSNIRNVIHYNIPQSIEGYYQEIGRAGRDGEKANCILLYSEGDVHKIKSLISMEWPNRTKINDLIKFIMNKNRKYVFANTRNFEIQIGIKDTATKLILHHLESSKAVGRSRGAIHDFKVIFKTRPEELLKSCNEEHGAALKTILNSNYFKHFKSRFSIEMLIEETNLDYFDIKDLFSFLSKNNKIEISDVKFKDLIIVKTDLRSFDISPLVTLFESILNDKYKKVDDLVKSLVSESCIRKNVLSYFDEPNLKDNCEMCSHCVKYELVSSIPTKVNKNYASDDEIQKLVLKINGGDELGVKMLKLVVLDKFIPKKDFIKILTKNLHFLAAPWKFDLISYGLMEKEDMKELEDILNKLISEELLSLTLDGDLRITRKGIEFLEE